MTLPQVHCNVNEKTFSWAIFLARFLTGLILIYIGVGCALFYREFLVNAAFLGLPVSFGVGMIVGELCLALLLVLGWMTRWVAGLLALCTAVLGFVFFASSFNKVYVVLLVLLLAALLPVVLLGPGRISLDFAHARRRVEKEFRD
jgi:putative oxidoreductase